MNYNRLHINHQSQNQIQNNTIRSITDPCFPSRHRCYQHFSIHGFVCSICEPYLSSTLCSYYTFGIPHDNCSECKTLESYKPKRTYGSTKDIVKHYSQYHNLEFHEDALRSIENTLLVCGKNTWHIYHNTNHTNK